jgi:hypothetical protein
LLFSSEPMILDKPHIQEISLKVPSSLIHAVARKIGVPDLAIQMFNIATDLSGLDKKTMPVELLPLNSIQLSRGLLNFTVLQNLEGWVLPFWAVRQYDPLSPSFVPRSHFGLSMNVTHRNWTGIGNPWCTIEPTVDPRGLLTLRPNSWSLDTWLRIGSTTYFPSHTDSVTQSLVDHLPIVETKLKTEDVTLEITAYTDGARCIQRVVVTNIGTSPLAGSVGIAVRPFNAEGVAPVETIGVNRGGLELVVNDDAPLHFAVPPSRVILSHHSRGDSASMFMGAQPAHIDSTIVCPFGLANAVAEFFIALESHAAWECTLWHDTDLRIQANIPGVPLVVEQWNRLLADKMTCSIPDAHVDALFKASHSSLLMSFDDTSVTPGPATYHYFWFRDAAYMLLAMERLGHSDLTRSVIAAYPDMQERSGMFRSQQGEWDSTGQALWIIWQHGLLTHDRGFLEELFPSMVKAAHWIDTARTREPGKARCEGLMPRGLSAEHLGLADVYYWDSFWSLAGLEAFVRICRLLNRNAEEASAGALAAALRGDITRSIAATQAAYNLPSIPAGPLRNADAGMIGSIAAWYPLQIFPPDDPAMHATMNSLLTHRLIQGMFYQPIVHSGLNAYLSLHIAQALLYAGDTEEFWRLATAVSRRATSTFTFPEAIHPATGGGSMGDGHHLWAAAEVVLAIRNAFILERWSAAETRHSLVLLGGIPASMFSGTHALEIMNAPIPEGTLSITLEPGEEQTKITIALRKEGLAPSGQWYLSLPGHLQMPSANDHSSSSIAALAGRHLVPIPSTSQTIICTPAAK